MLIIHRRADHPSDRSGPVDRSAEGDVNRDNQAARAEAVSRQAANDTAAGEAGEVAAGGAAAEGELRQLCLLIKADVDGTAEAVSARNRRMDHRTDVLSD
eukprot:887206-Prorocentrum_minimum.AAC.1